MTNTEGVAVLGLGAMGRALARTLLAAGHPTTVWNRTPERADDLVAAGAVRAATVTEAVAAHRLVLTCLLTDDTVTEVLAGVPLAGRILVNLTSGTPAEARALAAGYADAAYLDGGIMAVPAMIGGPHAFVLYSGPAEAYEAARPVLAALGEPRYLGTDPGLAALHDVALLSGMYGMLAGVLHALALVRSAALPTSDFAPLLRRFLTGMLAGVDRYAARVDAGEYGGDVGSSLAMQSAGWHHLTDTTAAQGLRPDLLAPIGELMRRRTAAGHGDEDLTGIIELLKDTT
ncbi:MAG TPA: NAD(P)-binding domain-containing protein [Actinocatenispora sp.]